MKFILAKQLVSGQIQSIFHLSIPEFLVILIVSCSSQRYSDYISPAQFHEACIDLATDLKEGNGSELDEFGFPRGAKFRVLDLRLPHEKEVLDMRDSIVVYTEGQDATGTTVQIPRYSLDYAELTTNMYDD